MLKHASAQAKGSVIIFGVASADVHKARAARMLQRPAQVVVVDPLLNPAAPPAHLLAGTGETAIIDSAPGPDGGEALVSVWSAPGLASLQEPTPALHALFPGLRRKSRLTARTQSLRALAREFAQLPDPIAIWIDMPGSEAELLSTLATTDLWGRVGSVTARSGLEPYFQGARDTEALIALMAGKGFAVTGRDDTDPDFPDLTFGIDLQQRQIAKLGAAVQTAEAALARAQAELQAARAGHQTATQQYRTAQAKMAALWQSRRDEAEATTSRLTALESGLQAALQARQAAQGQAQTEIAARDQRIAALEAELHTATQAQQAAEANTTGHLTALESGLQAALQARQAAQGQAQTEIAARDQRIAALEADIASRDQRLTTAGAELQAALQARDEARAKLARRDERITALKADLESASRAHEAAITQRDHHLATREAEAQAAFRAHAQVQTELVGRDERLATLTAELEARRAAEAGAQAEIAGRDHRLAICEAELQAAVQARDEARTSAQAKIAEREDRVTSLKAELQTALQARQAAESRARAEITERDQRLTSAEAELRAAIQARAQSEAALAARDARLTALESELTASQRDRETLRSEQAFNARLRAMLQLDLDNLRQRLHDSETQRLRQETLLRKLTPKLAQAAEHLKQLRLADAPPSPQIGTDAPKAPGKPRSRAGR